jgi:hypothetical protein
VTNMAPTEMVRFTCARCGFDGHYNPEFGHQCMKVVPFGQWEAVLDALNEALAGWEYVIWHWEKVNRQEDFSRIAELRRQFLDTP